jgi:hypothetical protein
MDHHPDSPPAEAPSFDPAPLRYRSDGWTPQRQRAFVEALADCGIIRQAAAEVGMSEQSVSRLRRRPDARAFDIACDAAQRIGSRRLFSIAFERGVEGTVRRHYFRGEVVGEERVYDNKLLVHLLGKIGPVLEPTPAIAAVEQDWNGWMDAIERGAPPPIEAAPAPPSLEPEAPAEEADEWSGAEVWEDAHGLWKTAFPPPADFDGHEGEDERGRYERALSPEEEAVIEADIAERERAREARRDRYFGFTAPSRFPPRQAELSETSEPSAPPPPSPPPPPATAPVDVHVNHRLSGLDLIQRRRT